MRRTRNLIALAAAAALLAGCAGGTGDEPTTDTTEPTTDATTSDQPTSEEPTTTAAPDDDAEGPPFPSSTDEQTADQTEAALLLVDVRVAEQPGFDRLVLEFQGEGEPGWRVGYVDEAATQGKGDPITLDGDSLLSVAALHTMPEDMTGYYDGAKQFDPDTEVIEEVFVDGTFEGETLVVLGIDGDAADPVPFRVFTLTDPTRLVVDVQDLDD